MRTYLSVAQAAKKLAISGRLLYQIISRREILHVRVNRKIVIPEDELERFMKERTIERVDWDEKAKEFTQ